MKTLSAILASAALVAGLTGPVAPRPAVESAVTYGIFCFFFPDHCDK